MRILTLLLLLLFPAGFCGLAQELSPKLRTWEAVNGNKVEAQFVSNNDGQVTLRGKNGKTFKVPLNKLSQADQDFILADSASPSAKEEPKSAEEIAAIARLAREWKEKVESRRNDGDRYYYEKGTDTLYSGKYYGLEGRPEGYRLEGRPEGYIEGTIKDGRFEGIFTIYRPSGSRMGAIRFKAGEQIEGSEKWWNDKGEPVASQRQALGKEEAKEIKNRASVTELLLNMKQVTNALYSYALDHDRRFPASLADLIPDYIEESVDKKLLSMECADGTRQSWHYVEGLTTESEAGKVILYSPEPIEGKWIVGFVDGSGQMMEEAKFRALLKDLKLPAGKGDSSSMDLRGNATNILVTQFALLSPGGNELNVDYGGQSRRLLITLPKKWAHQSQYPVLFCFHGAGGKADGPSRRWSPHAEKRGLIVISAEAVQPLAKWNFRDGFHAEEHDDVGFVLKVVEALIANKVVDPGAVYATGHSSGGLFCYRLAKQTDVFAALSPMSCGMVKGAHDPDSTTKSVPILQVIGDQDKSYKGSSNPKVTMYSAARRIDVWRTFNRCAPEPVVIEKGKEIEVHTYAGPSGMEVALCKVQGQGHFIRSDLRDSADSLALDFLLKHKKG
jgi:poly(3-hydroxybutyrate) depolymerase/antitoxin component YwqK of YwqJK toxin-antitoxin module